ncbi:hypothetical protein R1T16_05810 [Flavobacterium sp. DG1-102-2]|uniref:hypothetical protein n=1 Tax=Flavobacterium sp. DG1-102-2 TaxID=3081663 RepID=UPI0029491E1A|nr:hypothetical protein [Flavobacterium sp. DG1-102-2]MDV6167931.1 hypothetical protein [Flavobacterium sp. DG1-102-2]
MKEQNSINFNRIAQAIGYLKDNFKRRAAFKLVAVRYKIFNKFYAFSKYPSAGISLQSKTGIFAYIIMPPQIYICITRCIVILT